MTSRRRKPASPPPEEQWPWPERGGSYVRDPDTGALTPAETDTEETRDGAEKIPQKDRTGES